MESVTLNKDGSPRKRGSGRPKGASSFAHVTMSDLEKFIGKETLIPVSKTWLHNVAVQLIDRMGHGDGNK